VLEELTKLTHHFRVLASAPTPSAYRMLGIAYLVICVVRLISMFVDKSFEQSNYVSLGVEIIFGIILVV
jgi:hypothetical protein